MNSSTPASFCGPERKAYIRKGVLVEHLCAAIQGAVISGLQPAAERSDDPSDQR